MGIKDLELQFEKENEAASDDAIEVDLDLSFSAGSSEKKPSRIPRPKPLPASSDPDVASENVRSLQEARTHSQSRSSGQSSISQKVTEDVSALKGEIEKLKSEILNIKHSSDVKVAVAEAEKDYLIDYISNAKLLDHQVTQMLRSIHKKAPGAAAEVQNIKKYMNDFLVKSKPKK